jgi:hypothetical protein
MPLSEYAYNHFVVQEYSALTECRAIPVGPDFPDAETWLSGFVLNTIFRIRLPRDRAALGFALIRRAQGSIEDFDGGCRRLQTFVGEGRGIQSYFRCLQKFELAAHQTYQAFDIARREMKITLFKQGDGSEFQRLNEIYNLSRHLKPSDLPTDHLHPLWLQNDGVYCKSGHLTYLELRELIVQLANTARGVARGS